ncbi:MAG: CYTH domain-containing protein [Myxococcota bacterium]|nr:CYTH domain-containing protein [Myxococcota bacterium]
MPTEIERKFLVDSALWTPSSKGVSIIQAYVCVEDTTVVRVRILAEKAFLTIKGKTEGLSRPEYEYPVPVSHAQEMIAAFGSKRCVEKLRFTEEHNGMTWEIDIFKGQNQPLILAEIELTSEHQEFERPVWLGREVSDDSRYYNSNLAVYPFKTWSD